MKYKIRKQESNKDLWFYIAFYTIVGIAVILFAMFLIWIIVGFRISYDNALNTCLEKGYSLKYCESMLN